MMKDKDKDYSDADVKFIQGMIPHHESAIDSAAKAYHAAKNEDVREWARAIWAGQKKEVVKFRAWLKERDLPEKGGGGMKGMK